MKRYRYNSTGADAAVAQRNARLSAHMPDNRNDNDARVGNRPADTGVIDLNGIRP